jgi:hypothetical protein
MGGLTFPWGKKVYAACARDFVFLAACAVTAANVACASRIAQSFLALILAALIFPGSNQPCTYYSLPKLA